MKKIIPIFIVGILVFSGLGAATTYNNIAENTEANIEIASFNLDIAGPSFSSQDEFVTIELDESETFTSHSGEPMLPVITKTFSFPLGTRINDVTVDINWERYDLDRKITPTPVILPLSAEVDPAIIEEKKIDEQIYSSAELYPAEPYTVRMGAGIENMEHVVFVNVKCFPQYSPANDYVNLPVKIDIDVEHEADETSEQTFEEQYDLIIVTHDLFEEEFQPLVVHKESLGITTKLVTVDEIYDDYESESDYDWEQIKMYLADHVLDWDTKYVMLAGGHVGQTHEWYVPDFRSHCWDPADAYDPPYDETYSSDLYYADLFGVDQYGQKVMETWDTNNNGIYAEGPNMPSGKDVMDFYPDVHVGRIPLRYEWEADVIVNKIIDYENNADDSWFKKAVLAGGDGFPPERYGGIADPNAWEGEIVCDEFGNLLAQRGVESTKCYTSDQGDVQVLTGEDVYTEITKGAGFAHITGHANPVVLGSYTPGFTPLTLRPFYTVFNVVQQDNQGKLTFFVNEGCHNAQFDVTTQDLFDYLFGDFPDFIQTRWEWIPHDASSWMLLQQGGGAIGVIGNTALGLGGLNYGCTEFVGGWIMLRFAEAWAVDGKDYTGEVWTTGINGYIDNFDVSGDTGDRKTIEERALLGDPSVKLGGYSNSLSESEESESEVEYGQVSASAPTWSVGDSWTYTLDTIDLDLTGIEGRGITLQLSSGDIILEVTDVTSDSYITSIKANDMDVTFGAEFDFHIVNRENINIPTVSFDNINIDGEIVFDKENLGIKNMDLGLIADLVENLDNIEDILGMQLPGFVDSIAPFMSIPAEIDLNVAFENPFELLNFPLENDKQWDIPANQITVSIDGSIESIWLRLLSFVNKFVTIVPPEFAQYLPNVDISEVLNDFGIDTIYEFETPEINPALIEETPIFMAKGTENINIEAGSFNAVSIPIFENNAHMYYSESEGNIIQLTGYLSEYIPIVEDINLELKE